MLKPIFYTIIFTFSIAISKVAFAGPDSTVYVYTDTSGGCGKVSSTGETFVVRNKPCQILISLNPHYFYEENKKGDYKEVERPIRYWVESRPLGKSKFVRLSRVRITSTPHSAEYLDRAVTFKFQGTAQFRVAADYNENGYPEVYSNDFWLFSKK